MINKNKKCFILTTPYQKTMVNLPLKQKMLQYYVQWVDKVIVRDYDVFLNGPKHDVFVAKLFTQSKLYLGTRKKINFFNVWVLFIVILYFNFFVVLMKVEVVK
jgi:hypothetical protein